MKKYFIIYFLLIAFFLGLIYIVLDKGNNLIPQSKSLRFTIKTADNSFPNKNFSDINPNESQYLINSKSPLALFLLQIIIILIISRFFGILLMKIGQPSVVGEIIAGIVLGPSFLGYLFPGVSAFIFPPESLINLTFLSQIGLIFFMFIIGMELDLEKLKHKTQNAIAISHASIVVPFFFGVLVSYFLYEKYAPSTVNFLAFALFMGIAMSITAFPVLARIVKERGLSCTALGVMVITCAAADDVTAWCILAFVIAVVKSGGINSAIFTIVLALIYIFSMLKIVKPWLNKIFIKKIKNHKLNITVMSISFFLLLLSAYTSELIGIHALFGAFLAGVIIPRSLKVEELLTEKLQDISVILLLPIFFALTGLRTHLGLLNEGNSWYTLGLIITVAVLGKFGASALTARIIGYSTKDALSIGAFMNTRGLMELIVLNIGYDLGILSPTIFAIMVLMALITTFMTGPLLDLFNYLQKVKILK